MPGQLTLDTKYYPSDFGVFLETVTFAAAATTAYFPVLYADKPLLIDSVTIFTPAMVVTNGIDLKIKQIAPATVPVFATASQDVGTFTQLAAATLVGATQTMTFTKTSGVPNNNLIVVGNWVMVQISSVGTSNPAFNVAVQVRFRSQF